MTLYLHVRALLFFLLLLAFTGAAIAADYPALLVQEVPLYPDAQLESAAEDAAGASAVLNADASAEQVVRYYSELLTARGWLQTASTSAGAARGLGFSRDRSSLIISITPMTATSTNIALTLDR